MLHIYTYILTELAHGVQCIFYGVLQCVNKTVPVLVPHYTVLLVRSGIMEKSINTQIARLKQNMLTPRMRTLISMPRFHY